MRLLEKPGIRLWKVVLLLVLSLAMKILLHRFRREEGGRQEDASFNGFLVADGPGSGALR